MSKDEVMWVRVKPRNQRKGHRVKQYLVFGIRFHEARGWYKVPSVMLIRDEAGEKKPVNVIEYLSKVRNDNDDQDSALVFDITTAEGAKAIDLAEKKAQEEKAYASNPNSIPVDLTSDDVRYSRRGSERVETTEAPAPKRRGRPPGSGKKKPAAAPVPAQE